MTPLEALDNLSIVRRAFYCGEATHEEAVAAAEEYRAALLARKVAEPERFKRLIIPPVAKLLRG